MRHWIFFFCVALMMSQQHRQDIDSLVSEAVSRAIEEYRRTEQEHEVTTETLTETIDSLGRVVRQQQRTTDRTVSRQELQRQEQQIQEMKTSLQRHIEMQDSAWAAKFSQLETHLKDSLDQTIDKQSVTNAAPVTSRWKQLWRKFELIMTGMIFATALFVTRKFWIPWLKRLF